MYVGMYIVKLKQGVAITGRNRTGLLCSVSRPTAHTPCSRPARPPAALQTPASKTILAH